jgi:DNA repair exonuclease SbcCD ATPase subunit
MNAEAMAELGKGKDLDQGMKRVEEMLSKGDVDEAMRELDAMGSALQDMLSSLERAAGSPDERTAALSRQIREFQKDLASVEREQEKVAAETEKVRGEYRKAVQERLRRAEPAIRRIEELARKAQEELRQSRAGTTPRSEDDFAQARERLDDLNRALAGRDLDAALDASRRALPPMQRLATGLDEEALMSERFAQLRRRDPAELREAARHARDAVPPARQAREELEKLFPDARTVLPQGEQKKLDRLAKEQQGLEQQAGRLQQKLGELSQEAPIFPPQAMQSLGEGRGHMQAAASELGQKNPQRGLGQQREALSALERLRKGLEDMGKGGGKGEGGFPFPFADSGSQRHDGSEGDPSREKVEIPQVDASKAREEFRRDLLEAMKQGTPEPYQGEVKRYYEELVK